MSEGLKFAFVGVGQGGGKLAQCAADSGYFPSGAFVAINSTDTDFAGIEIEKLSLGTGGAGKDYKKAEADFAKNQMKVSAFLQSRLKGKFDVILVCASAGGGTGSGMANKIISVLKGQHSESMVGCLGILPSDADGPKSASNALFMCRKLVDDGVTPLIIISNKRVMEVARNTDTKISVAGFFPKANQDIISLLGKLNQFAGTRSETVSFDKAEFINLLKGKLITFGSAEVADYKDISAIASCIEEAASNALLLPLQPKTIKTAVCIFSGNEKVFSTLDINDIESLISQFHASLDSPDVLLHRGVYLTDDKSFKITLGVSGEFPASELSRLANQVGVKDKAKLASEYRALNGHLLE